MAGMSDLSSLASNALTGLTDAASGGLVEEYQVGKGTKRVRRGTIRDQVDAVLKLQKHANRAANGMCARGRIRGDRDC